MSDAERVVRDFVEAFEAEDADAFVATLHPEVVIHSSRGPLEGVEPARAWATRTPGGELWQHVLLDGIETSADGSRARAEVRRQWWWREPRQLASEEQLQWLFELSDGLVLSWRPSQDPAMSAGWL